MSDMICTVCGNEYIASEPRKECAATAQRAHTPPPAKAILSESLDYSAWCLKVGVLVAAAGQMHQPRPDWRKEAKVKLDETIDILDRDRQAADADRAALRARVAELERLLRKATQWVRSEAIDYGWGIEGIEGDPGETEARDVWREIRTALEDTPRG